jgi:hypothetical protein
MCGSTKTEREKKKCRIHRLASQHLIDHAICAKMRGSMRREKSTAPKDTKYSPDRRDTICPPCLLSVARRKMPPIRPLQNTPPETDAQDDGKMIVRHPFVICSRIALCESEVLAACSDCLYDLAAEGFVALVFREIEF